jgi:hypothetical protein
MGNGEAGRLGAENTEKPNGDNNLRRGEAWEESEIEPGRREAAMRRAVSRDGQHHRREGDQRSNIE